MTLRRKAIILCPLLIVTMLVVTPFSGCSFYKKWQEEKKILSSVQYKRLDLSDKPDGRYFGEFKLPLKSARVEVAVSGGTITNIKLLKHSHGPGFSGEGVIERVLKEQSLEVDAVSGATKSSVVVLKAIENAIF